MTDWLPTLYSAAGGNSTDLGELDGVDQWEAISAGAEPPRQERTPGGLSGGGGGGGGDRLQGLAADPVFHLSKH